MGIRLTDTSAAEESTRARIGVRSSARIRWVAQRWLSLSALALAIPLALFTTIKTLDWPGRPFPGFFVLCNNVVPTIGLYSWTGLQAGVPFHARLIAADDHRVQTSADVYEYAASLPVGTSVRYSFVKGEQTFTHTVPTMQFGARDYWLTVGAFAVNGVILIAVGVLISLLQPHTIPARVFLILGFVTGVFALTATALYHPYLCWMSPLHLLAHAVFPATFIHFGLVFPEERPFVRRRPIWLALPYLVSAVLAIWVIIDFYASPPRMTALYATYRYTAFSMALLVALVAFAYWENRTPSVRPRLRVVLAGLVLGLGTALVGFLNIAAQGGDFPINLMAITPTLFYLSLGYAVVKHDLFDIDALIKQAVVYLMLTLGITAAYVASVVALGTLLPPQVVRASPVFNVGFVVLVAILFQPLRTRVQHVIDRAFYRNRLDYRRTVVEVSAALTSLLDLDEIMERIGRTLTEGLQVRSMAVILWLDGATQIWRYNGATGRMVEIDGPACAALHDQLARAPRRPLYSGELGAAPADAADRASAGDRSVARGEMAALEVVLLVPLVLAETVIGAFALGTRRSGQSFSSDDLELLGTLAAQSAVAIQNARSYRALQALNEALEAKVHARTAELESSNTDLARAYEGLQTAQAQLLTTEKMASLGLIVAGVAHEINNPLSFIVGNVEPLHQTLAQVRTLATTHRDPQLAAEVDRLTKILGLMALGAERTATIVQDLRTFSRLGEAEPRPTDLHEAIEVSLRLLRPRWADRIAIHREYGLLTPVEVIPGQINQIFMNLLANACDAIRGRGNLWIRTACEDAHVTVTIRDDGTGIAPEHVARVFDPFFTTKPVGQGTGLGLAITQGIVSHHGGTIRVTAEPGKGTEFQIVLPTDGRRGAEDAPSPLRSSSGRRGT
jgi:signal transduction histidine kinase